MEDFIFYEGAAPSDFTFDYETSLFNLLEHRLLQSPDDWVSYYILQKKKQRIVAGIHFHISKFEASSPCKSPYGSVESKAKLEPIVLFRFLEYIEISLRKKGVHKIIIKEPPQVYHQDFQILLQTFLLNLKYQIRNAEVSAILFVDRTSDQIVEHWNKLKREKALDPSLELRHHAINQLAEIYGFIRACHTEKGYELSLSLDEIQKIANAFPQRFLLTSVFRHNIMVAACISILNKPDILYHFYSNHTKSADQLSPVLFLIKGLYDYAQENKFTLLDLGTSSIDGNPNFGLLDFKLRLGAKPISKLTFEKTLN